MAQHDLAIAGGRVLLPDGRIEPATIGVRAGRIVTLSDGPLDADETLDATGLTVLPGLIDEHFHVFWGYGWETYRGATRAAAKGGITTVVDMPLDKPPILSAARLQEKLAHVRSECLVDYALFGGAPSDDPEDIAALAEGGIVALKLFTGGVAPPGMYPGADTGQMLDCMRRARQEGLTVVVHCENAEIVDFETRRLQGEGRTDPGAWDEARPWYSELEAVQRVALVAEVTGCRTVIAHVTAPESVAYVRDARARGADVWIETCPHYLCVTLEDMAADTRLKWNPPSRSSESVERLWQLLAEGHVHTVGSDHAPLAQAPRSGHLDAAPRRRQRPRGDAPARRHRGRPQGGHARPGRRPALDNAGQALWPLPAQGHDRGGLRRRLLRRRDERQQDDRRAAARVPRAGEVVALRRPRGECLPGLHRPAGPRDLRRGRSDRGAGLRRADREA